MMWVAQGGDGARLVLEAPPPLRVVGKLVGQDLDRDLTRQARVAGAVHLAHAPGPEGAEDLVGTQAGSRFEGHEAAPRLRSIAPPTSPP